MIWGILLQFYLGFIIIRWRIGFQAFQWLGTQISTLFAYTDVGSKFVFGEKYTDHMIVFKVYVNPLYTGNPYTGTLANSEHPDKMQHYAAFHQGPPCSLKLKQSSRIEIRHNLENST